MKEKEMYLSAIRDLEKEKEKNKLTSKKIEISILSLNKNIKKLCDRNKYLLKTINILKSDKIEKISFIYKMESKNKYIKARFYWNRKQREVQIGTMAKTLDLIKMEKHSKNDLLSLQKINIKDWDIFSKNKLILKSINAIATSKIKKYILSKISKNTKPIKLYEEKRFNIDHTADSIKKNSTNGSNKKNFNKDWYSSWGDNN